MLILGIESSCDETSAAVVSSERTILSNVTLSQVKEHLPYGGVVPEIAARNHLIHLEHVIDHALKEAKVSLNQIDGFAVTSGPGLIGGVMVGVMTT
ncbi:MAG TPA: tRNA (adenosine(37)-N6)-threonylcarbamoyltransferase complex transferase subunit TsaD, partial [Candidatus Nitrosotenuis sp.]|nr:tRNA (adenosine(37)-N6)-threonylcarbamoyltransferase complex transferase subunit TsaD [Candidatus Nitrosotenuis sp.]